MRKIKPILIAIIAVFLTFPSVSAAAESQTLQQHELKELHSQVLDLVISDREDEIVNLPLMQKYKAIFDSNEELKDTYEKNLDAYVKDESKIVQQFETGDSKHVTVYEDGSFSIATNTLLTEDGIPLDPQIKPMTRMSIKQDTGEQIYTGTVGQQFTNDARHDLWGLYKTGELHLITRYTIASTAVTINSVSITETYGIFPSNIEGNATILSNNSRTVQSNATFNHQSTCPMGWGTCATHTHETTTTISIHYAENGTITFGVRSIVEGS